MSTTAERLDAGEAPPASRRSVSIRGDRAGEPIGEESLSRFFADHVQQGASTAALLRRPRALVRALIAVQRLPVVTSTVGAGPDGDSIRAMAARPLHLRVLRGTSAVVPIPVSRADYLTGRPKHALRQNIRTAEREGLSCREITDPEERRALLAIADDYERANPVLEFRNPEPDNDDMLALRSWVLTTAADGRPILLAVTAVDGAVASLRYYRTLGDDDTASVARYFTMPFLLDRLRALGVTHLAETAKPHLLPNGLRQFQRKVGFRLVRLRLVSR